MTQPPIPIPNPYPLEWLAILYDMASSYPLPNPKTIEPHPVELGMWKAFKLQKATSHDQ